MRTIRERQATSRCAKKLHQGSRAWSGRGWVQIVSTTLRAAMGVVAIAWPVGWPAMRAASAQATPSAQQIWTVPEVGSLPNNSYGRLVRRGRDLITATYAHIGPEVADRAKRFAGNNL